MLQQMQGKQVTSIIAHAQSQRYTKDSVFSLAQMMLCAMMSYNFCLLTDITSDCPTNRLSIRQFVTGIIS